MTSIDRLFSSSFDIVKISLQGYDIKAFRGGSRLFSKSKPKVLILDYNYKYLKAEVSPENFVIELFDNWGYRSLFVEATGNLIKDINALQKFVSTGMLKF